MSKAEPATCRLILQLVLMLLPIPFIGAVSNATIEQMYPMTNDYCCHCPSIRLKCKFPKNPLTASWTFLKNGIPSQVTVGTLGHTVIASEVPNGILYLNVSNSSYLENNTYTCSAVYTDGGVHESVSAPYPIPRIEDLNVNISNLTIVPSQDTLNVKWDFEFHLCRLYTVSLNGMPYPTCINMSDTNCTIGIPDACMEYEVTVTATEQGIPSVNASKTVPKDPSNCPTAASENYVWIPAALGTSALLALAVVFIIVVLTYIVKHKRKGNKPQPKLQECVQSTPNEQPDGGSPSPGNEEEYPCHPPV